MNKILLLIAMIFMANAPKTPAAPDKTLVSGAVFKETDMKQCAEKEIILSDKGFLGINRRFRVGKITESVLGSKVFDKICNISFGWEKVEGTKLVIFSFLCWTWLLAENESWSEYTVGDTLYEAALKAMKTPPVVPPVNPPVNQNEEKKDKRTDAEIATAADAKMKELNKKDKVGCYRVLGKNGDKEFGVTRIGDKIAIVAKTGDKVEINKEYNNVDEVKQDEIRGIVGNEFKTEVNPNQCRGLENVRDPKIEDKMREAMMKIGRSISKYLPAPKAKEETLEEIVAKLNKFNEKKIVYGWIIGAKVVAGKKIRIGFTVKDGKIVLFYEKNKDEYEITETINKVKGIEKQDFEKSIFDTAATGTKCDGKIEDVDDGVQSGAFCLDDSVKDDDAVEKMLKSLFDEFNVFLALTF